MRGEYLSATVPAEAFDELPPRARRILGPGRGRRRTLGTTSACAENTPGAASRSCAIWNYLRVRGEYIAYAKAYASKPELPPRARRIPEDILAGVVESGTTSACAENTQYQGTGRARCRNYLRVRGEYSWRGLILMLSVELPPRARRIQNAGNGTIATPGTTSACAENTPFLTWVNYP